MAEQVIIEFIVDTTQVQSAIDLLENMGQIDAKTAASFRQTNAEINKQTAAIKAEAAAAVPLKKNLEDVNKATKSVTQSFMQGFHEGVIDTLKDAGVSLDEFLESLKAGPKAAEPATESLRQRLRSLTEQIAQLKVAGQDNSEQFKQLVKEAGEIKDAIADAGAEIKNVASDTRAFDNLLGTAQAVAGGFAIAQGTAALFGDESEELQKTLLKVNAAMSILQGLQSVQNALQKEGAVVQLLSTRQRVIANAQIAIENGLQSQSILVRTGATVAQKALNAAMAANPIGIVAVAIAGVVTLLTAYANNARKAAEETAALNGQLASAGKNLEAEEQGIRNANERITSQLEASGVKRSEILENNLRTEQLINKRRLEEAEKLRRSLSNVGDADPEAVKEAQDLLLKLEQDSDKARIDIAKRQNEIKRQLRDEDLRAQVASAEAALQTAKEGSKTQLAIQQDLISLRSQQELNAAGLTEAEKTAISAKAIRDRHELQIAFNKRQIDLELKTIETRLINVETGSREELDLKLKQLDLQAQAEIQSTKLSEAEKNNIKEQSLQQQLRLQREYNERLRKEDIEAQIARNNAELANIQIASNDRLLLTVSNLELTSALEIDAAKTNAAKVKEITARRDADIASARKAAIEQQAQQEIENINVVEGANTRALQRIVNDEKRAATTREAAIRQLAELEIQVIQIREDALNEARDRGLISEREYNSQYAKLQDDKARIAETTEEKITDLHERETEKRRQRDLETIQRIAETSQAVIDLIGQANDIREQRDQQRLDGERERVQELLENGAITEREAIARNKRIDAEEKKLKREAAQRDKNLAIFNAVINTAAAITKALPNLVLAGIAAALGAAQIATIASRPIPKFGKGKKNRYEGPGIIGEDGAEIFEHDGKRYVAYKETLVWLGKDDKVYTPQETKRMLPQVDREAMKYRAEPAAIDTEKFASTVAAAVAGAVKQIPKTDITVDNNGFQVSIQEGLSRTRYMDKYYSSK